ncbi:MAG TPA: pyridoxal phosphate-dependent aminotransferase [Candidatus Saccharimonadales bacterium]|nr:pyridoxal phosphate-dependent aminotransferase [Candidatus Saccharimonadales bacterium]
MMKYANRMKKLGTETAFEVLARARELEAQGRTVVHLQIGEPDFTTPANIVNAGIEALRRGETHYTPSAGILPLRQAVAEFVREDRGLKAGPENVVVTPGAKPIMFYTLFACVNPGDEVIYPNPGFPIYESVIGLVGAKPVPIQLREKNEFRLDVKELRRLITPKTKLVILNSPQNPTGSVLTAEDLEAIAKLAIKHDLFVLADEIYSHILYEGRHASIATLPGMAERTIVLDGFSKTYAMTGWRLGYGVMNPELAKHVARLGTNNHSCTASCVQFAGVEALTGPQDAVTAMVSEFKRRRDVIVDGLNRLPGFKCLKPHGAFYVFPNITGTGMSSRELATRLLEEAGVACLSGTSFGEFGEGYLRFSYANSVEQIRMGLDRIGQFLGAAVAR